MLLLTCPACSLAAEETEFVGGGEAHLNRAAAGASDAELEDYLFARRNPKGVHFERWRHAYGCGKWFNIARCTATLEVFGSYDAQAPGPPEDLRRAIAARRPDWRGWP